MLNTGFRYAVRSLLRRPAFTLAAILTIAVGVGANTAVFHLIYSVLLQPLPFREPGRLVQLWESTPALPQLQVTVPDFTDWKKASRNLDLSAYTLQAMNKITLLGQGEPETVQGTMATADLLPNLGVQPMMGRWFSDEEERDKKNVALLSEALWRRKFTADQNIVGKGIRLEKETFTVIGVIRQDQTMPAWADVWIPFSFIEAGLLNSRKYHPLEVIGRMHPGVRVEQAQSEIQTISKNLSRAYPATNGTVGAYTIPLMDEITRDVKPSLLMVWAAVGMVLLIACANLAHLVLARISDRRPEMAIRVALGAGRGQLAQQVVLESLLLAASGGFLGALLALATDSALRYWSGGQIPRAEWNGFDAPIWLFAAAVSLLCAFLFGMPACWQVFQTHASLAQTRSGVRTTTNRSRWGAVLMASEVALAFLVVAGTALLTRSFAALLNENPGVWPGGVLTARIDISRDWKDSEQLWRTQLFPGLRALPGVQDVAVVNSVPFTLGRTEHSRFATRFGIEGHTYSAGHYPAAQIRWATPEYFRVLGIPLKSGRFLVEEDSNQPRYMVNDAFVRQFLRGEDPLKKRLILGVMDPQQASFDITGVVGDVREMGLDQEPPPILYTLGVSSGAALIIKTSGDPLAIAPAIRQVAHRADPQIAVSKIQTLSGLVSQSLTRRRFALTLLGAFGGLAAFLVAAGVYGILAYSVSRRVREFGIRSAIGATPRDLFVMILREATLFAIPGLLVGLALSFALARLMKALVYQISPLDPVSLGVTAIFLITVCLVSVLAPSRRAAGVDPNIALRQE